jgi:hypothetical protein
MDDLATPGKVDRLVLVLVGIMFFIILISNLIV